VVLLYPPLKVRLSLLENIGIDEFSYTGIDTILEGSENRAHVASLPVWQATATKGMVGNCMLAYILQTGRFGTFQKRLVRESFGAQRLMFSNEN
jgi:hypothetical protein